MHSRTARIVILGGGFGGVYAAKRLEKILGDDPDVELVLINDQNYFLFTPMLAEIPSSSIEAKHIISPLRAFFRKVKFYNSQVVSIDLESRTVTTVHCPACRRVTLPFDQLVLALGSTTNFFGLPGVAEHALPMKSLSDAMALRNHVIGLLEHADLESDSGLRRRMLTFAVAGGGFAGAETIAELHDFIVKARDSYPNIDPADFRFVLVHSGERILPEISESLAAYALRGLIKRNVEVLLRTKVTAAGADFVELSNGHRIPSQTLIWTAGVTPSPLLARLPCARNGRGQLIVNEHLEMPGYEGVWALGDCAAAPDSRTEKFAPPTAQHASRQGQVVAENIAAARQGTSKRAFDYKTIGVLASLGRRSAVAEILGFKFLGFFAWWLWRTLYLLKLPGLERKVRVALDWTLDLFFQRDLVRLKVFVKKPPTEVPLDTPS